DRICRLPASISALGTCRAAPRLHKPAGNAQGASYARRNGTQGGDFGRSAGGISRPPCAGGFMRELGARRRAPWPALVRIFRVERLVSRFRTSHIFAAASLRTSESKGHEQFYDPSAAFEREVRKRSCGTIC